MDAAPEVVLQLLSCNCSCKCKLPECLCLTNGLKYTSMCKLQTCDNQPQEEDLIITEADLTDSEIEDWICFVLSLMCPKNPEPSPYHTPPLAWSYTPPLKLSVFFWKVKLILRNENVESLSNVPMLILESYANLGIFSYIMPHLHV